MKIRYASVLVNDQAKAHKFYTEVLGFETKMDLPLGDARWLTVVSSQAPDGVELLLEPMGIAAAEVYQKALYDAGIPATVFEVDDIEHEVARMQQLGVRFLGAPMKLEGGPTLVTLDDTCGNLIQLAQG